MRFEKSVSVLQIRHSPRSWVLCVASLLLAFVPAGNALAAPVANLYVHPSGGAGSGFNGNVFEFADEFTVPAGQTWRVTGVINDGFATPGPNYTVTFYANSGGAPGVSLCSRTTVFPVGPVVSQTFGVQNPDLRLPTPCVLAAGNYFFAFRRTGATGNANVSSTPTIVGNEMRIRSTINSTCGSNFVPVSSCLGSPQDLRFTVRGCQAASCEHALSATAACVGADLVVDIGDGDAAFDISGSGPGLPRQNVGISTQIFPGPAIFRTLGVVEQGGDTQALSFGTRNCGLRFTTLAQTAGSTDVSEAQPAQTDSYTVVLGSLPDDGETVTITPSSNATTGVTVSPASVSFTNLDWNVPKTFTVAAVDDDVYEPGGTDTITHALTTTAGGVFTGASVGAVVVNIADDDEDIFANGFEGPP
jgi:hypothetical protein